MKNFNITRISNASDDALKIIGNLTIHGKTVNTHNRMIECAVDESDDCNSIETVMEAFTRINDVDIILVHMDEIHDEERFCIFSKTIRFMITESIAVRDNWFEVNTECCETKIIAFKREEPERQHVFTLELILPTSADESKELLELRDEAHKAFVGMGDYIDSNVIISDNIRISSECRECTWTGINIDCGAVIDMDAVALKTEQAVHRILNKLFSPGVKEDE